MGVAALFIVHSVNDGRMYKSRVTGRTYRLIAEGHTLRVYINGRCIYGGGSPDAALKMIELEDCL